MLDARQRAMLAEMGVRVWTPAAALPDARADTPVLVAKSLGTARGEALKSPETGVTPVPRSPHTPRPPLPPPSTAAPTPAPAEPPARAPRPEGVEQMDWPQLEAAVAHCRACGLCEGRTQTVFGVGSRTAEWMVIGEAPGENEDKQGQPFVGQAGKLLDNMLAAAGRSRQAEDAADSIAYQATSSRGVNVNDAKKGVYIANVLKCRPPANRNPQPAEIAQCEPYLRRQVALVQPRIILAMGRFAVQSLLQSTEPIGRLRGRVHHYQEVPVIVTYHPAYLLRALGEKAKAWEDLCLALEVAGSMTG